MLPHPRTTLPAPFQPPHKARRREKSTKSTTRTKKRKRSRAKRTQRVPPRILAHHRCSPDDRQRLRTGLCFRCAAAPPASPPSVFSHHWVSCGAAQKVKAAKGPESEASSTQHTLRKKERERERTSSASKSADRATDPGPATVLLAVPQQRSKGRPWRGAGAWHGGQWMTLKLLSFTRWSRRSAVLPHRITLCSCSTSFLRTHTHRSINQSPRQISVSPKRHPHMWLRSGPLD